MVRATASNLLPEACGHVWDARVKERNSGCTSFTFFLLSAIFDVRPMRLCQFRTLTLAEADAFGRIHAVRSELVLYNTKIHVRPFSTFVKLVPRRDRRVTSE